MINENHAEPLIPEKSQSPSLPQQEKREAKILREKEPVSDSVKWLGQNVRQPFRFQIPVPNPPPCPCYSFLDGDIDPKCTKHGDKR